MYSYYECGSIKGHGMYVGILMTDLSYFSGLLLSTLTCVVCNVPQQLAPEGVAGRSREVGGLEKKERRRVVLEWSCSSKEFILVFK